MKKPKEKILKASLQLFNENGMVNVTLRQIAQELKISQGNLNYHFKLKEDIIEALYFQLVEEMNNQMKEMSGISNDLVSLYKSSLQTMEKMYEYRFIMIDFIHLMNENKRIKTHYSELMKTRKEQFQMIFQLLINSKTLRPPEFQFEYERLYQRMNIIGDSWINVFLTFDQNKSVNYYFELLFEMIYPYLTKEGKEDYQKIIKTAI